MTGRRRGRAFAGSTLLAVAIGMLLAVSAQPATESKPRPRGAVENCATQSGADFPGAFTNPGNLVLGPLALIGAAGTPPFVWNSSGDEGFQKFPLLVKNDHRVTIALPRLTRRGAGLAYGPLPQGEVHLRDTHRVVAFIACTGGHSASTADGRRVTFWSGAVQARSPRCVPLLVWIDNRPVRRVLLHLGVADC